MTFVTQWFVATWELLAESSVYVFFGLLIGGLLKVFMSPSTVLKHLGRGRFTSVLKASLLGIPMPLCSCGVLPAGASLKRQGANNGATTAFLISTPETGVDSIAITYALLGPIMTVARPVAAFVTASVAGFAENILAKPTQGSVSADMSCPIDGCCDGQDCSDEEHRRHHTIGQKLKAGLGFAFGELWADLAGWFMVGMVLAGVIAVVVPEDMMATYLGGGLSSMLLMLAVGIPLYICATASTPIAAMLILKGVSPGTALVFLMAGPATNITSLSVLTGVLGKRATSIYLASIAIMSVVCGLALDGLYLWLGLSAQATLGTASEIVPHWLQVIGAIGLLGLSVKPIARTLRAKLSRRRHSHAGHDHDHDHHAHGDETTTPQPDEEVEACSGST